MNPLLAEIKAQAVDALSSVSLGSREAFLKKAELARLVEAHREQFLRDPDPADSHRIAVEILNAMQELTPGCTTPSMLRRDDPWVDQDPFGMSEEELALAHLHRESVTFESLSMTLSAIFVLGDSAKVCADLPSLLESGES